MSPHNLGYDSSSSESPEKLCKGCGYMKPPASFSQHLKTADGLRAKCKECIGQAYRDSKSIRDPDLLEPPAKRLKLEPATIPGEHLYIMSFSTDPDGLLTGLKVGRSGNIAKRAHDLDDSMPFHILVLATFLGKGHLEGHVHASLADCRNRNGRGREWFHAPLVDILQAVVRAMQVSPIVNGACGSQSSSGPPWCCSPLAGGEEEGSGHYSEASGELCEEEGGEAGVSSGSAGER